MCMLSAKRGCCLFSTTPNTFRNAATSLPPSSQHSRHFLARVVYQLCQRRAWIEISQRVPRMSSRFEWMLMILGLIVLARSGSALRCWDCASNTNPFCGDPMNITEYQTNFHIKNCEPRIYETTKPLCRKIVKRENGERVVIRQCSTPYVDEADITDGPCGAMPMTGRHVIESCHICSTDVCNSATSASVMQPLYLVALALVSYRFFQTKYGVV